MTAVLPIKVYPLREDAHIPKYAHPGDSGFDLVAAEEVLIPPGTTVEIPTGLAFVIPEGFELQIRPRSGISSRTFLRVANPPGTIDSSFRGEVKVLLQNTVPFFEGVMSDGVNHYYTIEQRRVPCEQELPIFTYKIRKGDRIAQVVVAPVFKAEFEVVDSLPPSERGEGGFGSTGFTQGVVRG